MSLHVPGTDDEKGIRELLSIQVWRNVLGDSKLENLVILKAEELGVPLNQREKT